MADYMEKRDRRGIFGMTVAVIFWSWHALMAVISFFYLSSMLAIEVGTVGAGFGIAGGGIGFIMVLLLWVLGAAILLIPFKMTRGKKRWIQE